MRAESATAGARDRGAEVRAAVVDAAPLGGDSVEVRMRRAQEAAERAREAEDRGARGRAGVAGTAPTTLGR